MTDYQKSKRRGDSTPTEKKMVSDALEREQYLKRIRILEEKVMELERIARSLGYCVDGRYE